MRTLLSRRPERNINKDRCRRLVWESLEERLALSTLTPDAVQVQPTVVTGLRSGVHTQSTSLVIFFSQPMGVASVQDVNNYILLGQRSGRDPIVSALYDAATQSVTLQPKRRLKLHFDYFLQIRAQGPNPVSNVQGMALNGDYGSYQGIDYTALIRGFSVTSSIPNLQANPPTMMARVTTIRHAFLPQHTTPAPGHNFVAS
jgi:hypothetical protein